MKNIHVLPTEKPSRLSILNSGKLNFGAEAMSSSNSKLQHIYITSDEKIKERDYFVSKEGTIHDEFGWNFGDKKIILTTDQNLIDNGVQAIDDDFLEWFVKNPGCEFVEIVKCRGYLHLSYMIITPKEEPKQEPLSFPPFDKEKADVITKEGQKVIRELRSNIQQETLEEAAYRLYPVSKGGSMWMPSADDCNKANKQEGFIQGAKWQEERMYSDMEEYSAFVLKSYKEGLPLLLAKEWFEQSKQTKAI